MHNMKSVTHFRLLSAVSFTAAALVIGAFGKGWRDAAMFYTFLQVATSLVLMVTSLICLDISRRKPCNHCTAWRLFSLWRVYVPGVLIKLMSLEKFTSNFIKEQEKMLMWCLETNGCTKYAEDFHLAQIKSVSEFRLNHPLTTYDHYRPYVDRRIDGETNVQLNESKFPVDFVVFTSGTSGKNKVYPYNWGLFNQLLKVHAILVTLAGNKMIAKTNQRSFTVRPLGLLAVAPKLSKTKTGIDCGSLGAKSIPSLQPCLLSFPKVLYEIHTEREFYYIACVFSLQYDLSFISHSLAPSTLSFYRQLEAEWSDICTDIEMGALKRDLDIPLDLRSKLELHLQPNPERAEFLRVEFSKGMFGIVRRVWPDMRMVVCVLTGSFSNYREPLSHYLDGVLVYTNMHAATEGIFGINIWPEEPDARFMLCPTKQFYEFIPEEELQADSPSTVLAHQVEVGKNYELVVTNPFGFYRYRIGDVIKIESFEGQIPVYRFLYRLGQMLNAHWEKTPESAFLAAVEHTLKEWGDQVVLIEYTATEGVNMDAVEDRATTDKFYVVFVEVCSKSGDSVKLSDEQKERLDDNLRKQHELYDILRERDELKPMVVHQVKNGCFQSLKNLILSDNDKATASQFKVPRVQRNKKYLQFLADNYA